jgi:hypothetical protein
LAVDPQAFLSALQAFSMADERSIAASSVVPIFDVTVTFPFEGLSVYGFACIARTSIEIAHQ